MLVFKKVDAYAQIVLIVLGLIFSITIRNDVIILSYFIVGGWQVLSALIHFIGFKKMPVYKGRKWYLIILIMIVVVGVLSVTIAGFIIFFFMCLLIVPPFLAIWYAAICFGEIKLWERYQFPETT